MYARCHAAEQVDVFIEGKKGFKIEIKLEKDVAKIGNRKRKIELMKIYTDIYTLQT